MSKIGTVWGWLSETNPPGSFALLVLEEPVWHEGMNSYVCKCLVVAGASTGKIAAYSLQGLRQIAQAGE